MQLSGLFCAADFIFERIKEEQQIDVFLAVQKIRANRPQFITSYVSTTRSQQLPFFLDLSLPNKQEQYHYLHQVALAYLKSFDHYANFK